jgi:hypothetical protein
VYFYKHITSYLQAKKKPTHGQAHLVFTIAQSQHRKPKELALPIALEIR